MQVSVSIPSAANRILTRVAQRTTHYHTDHASIMVYDIISTSVRKMYPTDSRHTLCRVVTCLLSFERLSLKGGVFREGREMRRDVRRYFKDKWNIFDALGLLCLFIGMTIRWNDCSSRWGPAFYALSIPLVTSRVLFFAQILPFQGPMIEVSSHVCG